MIKKFEDKMQKSIESLVREYNSIRAGRANPHVLDKIKVDYYGHLLHYSRLVIFLFQNQELSQFSLGRHPF